MTEGAVEALAGWRLGAFGAFKPATCRRSVGVGMKRAGQSFSRLHVDGHADPDQLDEMLGVPIGEPEAAV